MNVRQVLNKVSMASCVMTGDEFRSSKFQEHLEGNSSKYLQVSSQMNQMIYMVKGQSSRSWWPQKTRFSLKHLKCVLLGTSSNFDNLSLGLKDELNWNNTDFYSL